MNAVKFAPERTKLCCGTDKRTVYPNSTMWSTDVRRGCESLYESSNVDAQLRRLDVTTSWALANSVYFEARPPAVRYRS